MQKEDHIKVAAVVPTSFELRPWGHMHMLEQNGNFWVKSITVAPQKRLSLQSHEGRSELWACINGELLAEKGTIKDGEPQIVQKKVLKAGDYFFINKGELHRLSSQLGGTVVEVAFGEPREEDNVRWEDDHGRI